MPDSHLCTDLRERGVQDPANAHFAQYRIFSNSLFFYSEATQCPLTFHPEVLSHHARNVYAALGSLGVVPVLEVENGHAVQPGLPQLRGVTIGEGQTVMEVHQLLWVILVDLCVWGWVGGCDSVCGGGGET